MTKSLFEKPELYCAADGKVVTMTLDHTDIKIIEKYKASASAKTLKQFASEVVTASIRWMERMINGPELFELSSMDYWTYQRETNKLILQGSDKLPQKNVVVDMSFTEGTLQEYNQGLATIISSFWYKTHALPPVVVELIACCDLLYREHHNNMSPAGTARIPYTTE